MFAYNVKVHFHFHEKPLLLIIYKTYKILYICMCKKLPLSLFSLFWTHVSTQLLCSVITWYSYYLNTAQQSYVFLSQAQNLREIWVSKKKKHTKKKNQMHLMILLYSHFSSTEIEFHMRDCVKPFKSFSLLVVISHSKWKASCKNNLHTKNKKV